MAIKLHRLIFCCWALIGCTSPASHFAEVAHELGLYGIVIHSGTFAHQVYVNPAAKTRASHERLHVYLDGDGTPWEHERWLADDPTSRHPMILKLLQQDPSPAIFLGRPCYHGFSKTGACHAQYWTSHRYSQTVVNGMVTAVQKYLLEYPAKQVVLIGYSGGGTLAALMASYLPTVKTLVTIAANLDVDAWSDHHGYGRLPDSLNPATISNPSTVRQIHLAGLKDRNVPAQLIKAYVDKQPNARYIPFAAFDHYCCWVDAWRSILLLW